MDKEIHFLVRKKLLNLKSQDIFPGIHFMTYLIKRNDIVHDVQFSFIFKINFLVFRIPTYVDSVLLR